METTHKSRFSFVAPRRVEIGRKLRGIDQTLQLLATTDSAALEAASGESIVGVRTRLLQERASLAGELQEAEREPARPMRATGAGAARSGPGTGESQRAGGLFSIFQAGSCTPIQQEVVNIPPVEFGCDFVILAGVSPYSSFEDDGFEVSSPPSAMVAEFRIQDPNNDPYNADYNRVFVVPWWRYQLPERALKARYDVSTSAALHIDVTGSSNNVLGSWFWACWVNGFMTFWDENRGIPLNYASPELIEFQQDAAVAAGTKPMFARIDATPYDSGDVAMNRSIEVAAGDAPPAVLLMFPMTFWVDRGSLNGLVRATQGDPAATLRCTITQNP